METLKEKKLEEITKAKTLSEIQLTAEKGRLQILEERKKQIYADNDTAIKTFIADQKSLLSEEDNKIINEREICEKSKHTFLKWLSGFVIVFGLAVFYKSQLQSAISINNFLFYILSGVIAIIGGIILASILNVPQNAKIKRLSSNPSIVEYDKKLFEFKKSLKADEEALRNEIKKEEDAIKNNIIKIDAEIENADDKICDLKFPNTMFIFTPDSIYFYEVYIDGLLYQKHKGKKLFEVTVSEGFHSIRIVQIYETSEKKETTQLGTIQFNAQNNAYFFIAGYNLEQCTRKKFIEECSKKIKGFSL